MREPAPQGLAAAKPEQRPLPLQELIETTQDAVVLINRKAEIVRFNPAAERMFGYSETEVRGKNVSLLMPEPYRSQHDDYIHRYEKTGEPHAIGQIRTVEARRKNGEVFPIELSVTATRGGGVSYGAFIRDISEKVRLHHEVSEKKRLAAIGATAAALAHEVGNPLNNLRLQAQIAQRRLDAAITSDEGLALNLKNITEEIARLGQLLEEFRLLSRREQLHLSETNVTELIQQICNEHEAEFEQQQVRVVRKINDSPPVLRADPGKLRQVLLNVCKNALEAMPNGGTLTVTVAQTSEELTISVADTGSGIPNGIDIFEPFNTTKDGGTGLGLPIARRIVTAHGGTISYASSANEGTVFRIALPLCGPPPPSEPPPPLVA